MPRTVSVTRQRFLEDPQGRTFSDVLDDLEQPFDDVLAFLSDPERQRRMEDSEIHHDRPALAGVVREFESQPAVDRFLTSQDPRRTKRLRQAVGVVVRIVMERRGWKKTGKKGSMGVRNQATRDTRTRYVNHNNGGLAFWFLRAERYERADGMPFLSTRERAREFEQQAAE